MFKFQIGDTLLDTYITLQRYYLVVGHNNSTIEPTYELVCVNDKFGRTDVIANSCNYVNRYFVKVS